MKTRILFIIVLTGLLCLWSIPLISAQTQGTQLMNANTRLNVRSGPGVNFDVIGIANPGEIYTVLNTRGSWAEIDYLGKVGYVARNLVTITGSTPIQSEAALGSDVFYTSGNRVNLRAGAGTIYGRLTVLPLGVKVKATRRTLDNQWLEVEYNGQRGWVAARYGSISGNVYSLPTIDS